MNQFRKIQEICQGIEDPKTDGVLGDDEHFDDGYRQGQYDLAQKILVQVYTGIKKQES